jgi:hypothetical protein
MNSTQREPLSVSTNLGESPFRVKKINYNYNESPLRGSAAINQIGQSIERKSQNNENSKLTDGPPSDA